MTVDESFKYYIEKGVLPILKAEGFKKSGLHFTRRHGATLQRVSIQKSHGNQHDHLRFYTNVIIGFDKIYAHQAKDIPSGKGSFLPHFSNRIESIVTAPAYVDIDSRTDVHALADTQIKVIEDLCRVLNKIEGVEGLIQPTGVSPRADLMATAYYVLGQDVAAREWLEKFSELLKDRKNTNFADLVERLNLPRLI